MGSLLQKLQEELTDLTEGLQARQAKERSAAEGAQGRHPNFLTDGGLQLEQVKDLRLERQEKQPRARKPGLEEASSQRMRRQHPRQPHFKGCMVLLGLERQDELVEVSNTGLEFSLKDLFFSLG